MTRYGGCIKHPCRRTNLVFFDAQKLAVVVRLNVENFTSATARQRRMSITLYGGNRLNKQWRRLATVLIIIPYSDPTGGPGLCATTENTTCLSAKVRDPTLVRGKRFTSEWINGLRSILWQLEIHDRHHGVGIYFLAWYVRFSSRSIN